LAEVVARFGSGTAHRLAVTRRLEQVYQLALATGHLDRFFVFGSYVSDVDEPNDVDVILVMRNDFRSEDCPVASAALFDHTRAHDELGASVFWIRPDMLLGEPLANFMAFWQTKRDAGDEASWRFNHDSERLGIKSHAGAHSLPPRPAQSVADQ
jgi:hypothetical protein